MSIFEKGFIKQARRNQLLRNLWNRVPYKERFKLYQYFSLYGESEENLTKALIDIFKEEPWLVAQCDKKDEVLKFLRKNKWGHISPEFPEIWLQKKPDRKCVFNFNGAIFPYLKDDLAVYLYFIFADTFLFSLFFNDTYPAELVKRLEKLMEEGPYGYTDENFDVTVKAGDIVIDAGAWVGDFSAYASGRSVEAVYAFEPTSGLFEKLCETAEINTHSINGGRGEFFR
jgi:hypothetical protein